MKTLNILIVEDHELVQHSLQEVVLSVYPGAKIDKSYNIKDGLAKLNSSSYDLVVSDLGFDIGKRFDIVEACRQLNLPCMVLTSFSNPEFIQRAIDHKAMAYVLKTSPLSAIRQGLQNKGNSFTYLCPDTRSIYSQTQCRAYYAAPQLLPIEEQVLKLTLEGLSQEEIANHLNKSYHTVRHYRREMLRKNECNMAELIKRYLAYQQ